MVERARLVGVEYGAGETDSRFWFEYHRAVLLSLKEGGALDEAQYRYAEEKLRERLGTYHYNIYKKSGGDERGGGT